MSFEIYRTSATLSGRPAAVPAGQMNLGMSGQGVAEFGKSLMDEGIRLDLLQADTQFTKAKAQAREEHDRMLIEFQQADPSEYEKLYEESMIKRQNLRPANRRAGFAYDNWLTSISPYWSKNVDDAMEFKTHDNFRAAGFEERQRFIEGLENEYFIHLAKGMKLGAYKAEEAAKYRQYAIDARERYAKLQQAQRIAQNKESLDKYVEEKEQKWFSDLIANNLDINEIDADKTVPSNVKLRWKGIYDTWQKNTLKGKETVTNIILKNKLKDKALMLKSGAVLLPDLRADIAQAWARKELDDSAYNEVADLMRTEFRAGQDVIIARRIAAANKKLIDYPDEYTFTEYMNRLTTKFEKEQARSIRELQWSNYDRYISALTKLREEEADISLADLEKKGLELLDAFDKSYEQLRREDAVRKGTEKTAFERGFNFINKMNEAGLMKTKIPSSKYKEQINYLSITFNLTEEERQKARELLDQGYTLDDLVKHLQSK